MEQVEFREQPQEERISNFTTTVLTSRNVLPRPILLSNKVAEWFGDHTGYHQLAKYILEQSPDARVIMPRRRLPDRVIGKLYSTYRRWPGRNQYDAAAEFRFDLASREPNCVRHMLHFDEQSWYIDRWKKAPREIIGTIHLPPSRWEPEEFEHLHHLSSAIVLYTRDIKCFERIIGPGRVIFIRHGVDIVFFRPGKRAPEPQRLLFAGHYLRNTAMLQRVVQRLSAQHPDLRFDLLVPEAFRNLPGLPELKSHPAVTWHSRLSDEQLRELINNAYVALLPMDDSGANNAVIESLACGTPVVTTDVGGIRDYGGGTIFPIVPNDDDDAMIQLVERYLAQPAWRARVAAACRDFAVEQLAWPLIAAQHLAAYETLTS